MSTFQLDQKPFCFSIVKLAQLSLDLDYPYERNLIGEMRVLTGQADYDIVVSRPRFIISRHRATLANAQTILGSEARGRLREE